jgi:pimeloyl-ACP methyl ester carboxylesterase
VHIAAINAYDTLVHGSGIPLIMLHGVLGRAANWAQLLPRLPLGCQGIALNFPFFQASPALASLAALEEYAFGMILALNAPQVVLAGNSIGGHVALNLALRLRSRVAGLVLTGSSGLVERNFGVFPGLPPPREWLAARIREVFYDPACTTDELVDSIAQVFHDKGCVRRLVKLFMSARLVCMASQLKHLQCPTLLVWGRQDIVTPPEAGRRFHELLPDSELHWLDRCGHVPMLEHPELFARLLDDWWQRRIAVSSLAYAEVA